MLICTNSKSNKMKKYLIPIVILVVLFLIGRAMYNGLISNDENVSNAWAKVQSAYQERADLVNNLVATVKGAASHERETLEAVIKARAEATSTKIDASSLTPENMAKFQAAQSGLSGALGKLMVVVERYPDLKANQNFLELQSQLEGIENRVRVERNRFNDEVTIYNKSVRSFPMNILAMIFGYETKTKFEADEASQTAPKVEF